jgi:tRNA (guanine37-N1)-methyltransferase
MGGNHIFNILTLFPETVGCFLRESIVGRAIERGIIEVNIVNIRDFSKDKHRKVDDYPFGGGKGMILKPDPIFRAVESLENRGHVIYLTPAGHLFNQTRVRELKKHEIITLICGHYEGIDHRVVEALVDEEISIGDYILTGGEIAAAVIVDSITRELDESLGNRDSRLEESFDSTGLLEFEQYTRPAEYRGLKVPEVLLSGNHEEIRQWRIKRRLLNTMVKRPDLLHGSGLSPEYQKLLQEIREEQDDEHR